MPLNQAPDSLPPDRELELTLAVVGRILNNQRSRLDDLRLLRLANLRRGKPTLNGLFDEWHYTLERHFAHMVEAHAAGLFDAG